MTHFKAKYPSSINVKIYDGVLFILKNSTLELDETHLVLDVDLC